MPVSCRPALSVQAGDISLQKNQKITPATTDDIHFLSNFAISLKFEAHETGQ